jgi:hypothetical protein
MRRGESAIDFLREYQLQKFAEREYKGEWKHVTIGKLLTLMRREFSELTDAVGFGDHNEAIRECADIANYAAIIADVLRLKSENLERSQD